jgi:hypothetical protein
MLFTDYYEYLASSIRPAFLNPVTARIDWHAACFIVSFVSNRAAKTTVKN